MTLLTPHTLWTCPNCKLIEQTTQAGPHTRFHACKGLKGITAPMVRAGSRVKVTAVEREDYIGNEQVQLSPEGRPVMAVVTEREDGSNDTTVFAPTAIGRTE